MTGEDVRAGVCNLAEELLAVDAAWDDRSFEQFLTDTLRTWIAVRGSGFRYEVCGDGWVSYMREDARFADQAFLALAAHLYNVVLTLYVIDHKGNVTFKGPTDHAGAPPRRTSMSMSMSWCHSHMIRLADTRRAAAW